MNTIMVMWSIVFSNGQENGDAGENKREQERERVGVRECRKSIRGTYGIDRRKALLFLPYITSA